MKKRNLKSLGLNKKSISKLDSSNIKGGGGLCSCRSFCGSCGNSCLGGCANSDNEEEV